VLSFGAPEGAVTTSSGATGTIVLSLLGILSSSPIFALLLLKRFRWLALLLLPEYELLKLVVSEGDMGAAAIVVFDIARSTYFKFCGK
jgi:hypothetical protein